MSRRFEIGNRISHRPKRLCLTGGLLLSVFIGACAAPCIEIIDSPLTLMPGTDAEMNSAGYWMGRHPDPDRLIMDDAAIAELNRRIREMGKVRDLADYSAPVGRRLRRDLEFDGSWAARKGLFLQIGQMAGDDFLDSLMDSMDLAAIEGRPTAGYAFLTRGADLRVLPTSKPLYERPGDIYFDQLQASALAPGTAVRVLHRTRDRAWTYGVTERGSGWMPSTALVSVDEETFLRRYRADTTIVVTAPRADLFEDAAMTRFIGTARMGTRFGAMAAADGAQQASGGETASPFAPTGSKAAVAVFLPSRRDDGSYRETTAFVSADQVSAGFLPYTPRTILRQAFRLLNAPYGWGGMFGEQDCSQMVLEIFSTVGIVLPRSTRGQSKIGAPLSEFDDDVTDEEKVRVLVEGAVPATTLLFMPGHIMLYLGTVDGRPYAIHAAWAYRRSGKGKDEIRLINRVVVTTLTLGRGSEKGSYIRRLTAVLPVALSPNNQESE